MAPGYEKTPTRPDVQANIMGTPAATAVPPTPTPEPLILDNTPYLTSSNTFRLRIPQGWSLASEDDDYAKFVAPDQQAWFEIAVESSGYQLSQDDFKTYMDNMLSSLYQGADSFELLDSQVEEGQATFVSTIQKNSVTWMTMDYFLQRDHAIYALSFHTLEMLQEAYQPGFQAVIDSLETNTGYVDDKMSYTFMRPYTSPNNEFTLTIPMGWSFVLGQDKIKGAILDGAYSPDGQAAVEIVAYDGKEELQNVDIGQISYRIIKQLYSNNMHIHDPQLLNDGRIRVDWEIGEKSIRGFSFFWQDKSIVYILSFKYSDQYSGTYQNVIYRVGDSFKLSAAG